ncbi:MAG TPA: hypothetical protein VMQ62_07720, partial [Dongiaceae bacterium]|nr:hypothetical protein [Dongiaceae bacterium]
GVLRNASGQALDGNYDMIFGFWSAASGGDEILIDDWSQGVGGPVQVSKGLFNVQLGAGFPSDGHGPGIYTSLAQVFRDYTAVYLEVKVGAETLTPRTLLLSAPSALNSDYLDGKNSADFIDTSATPQTKAGQLFCGDGVYAMSSSGGYGTESYGATAGGFFKDANSSGFGWIGYGDRGIHASGSEMGAYFKDTDQSGYSEIGSGDYGLKAYGNTMGGRFQDLDSSAFAYAAYGDQGVYASGNVDGVFGISANATGYGVHGQGGGSGGFFQDRFATGQAEVGKDNRGIEAQGSEMGGFFKDTDNTSFAYIAYGNFGAEGLGTTAGGYFSDNDLADSGYAYVGYGDFGIQGFGESSGGYFKDSNSTGMAFLGDGDWGLAAYGSDRGGFFSQTGGSGTAMVAWNDRGVQASGDDAGAYFSDLNSSSFALLGYGSYKIYGSGAMSFVQNHPTDKDRVIVYTAPEGDETATYTRGTAKLVNGEARVPLGETFAWVTNPDLGLTAYVTPHDRPVPLAVDTLTTDTLTVHGPAGENLVFDYIVYGLRIGFEETTVVQEKVQEARIPSMADHRRRMAEHPEMRRFTAQDRFDKMEKAEGRPAKAGGAALALRSAVEEFDPARHGRPHADREPNAEPAGVLMTAPARRPTAGAVAVDPGEAGLGLSGSSASSAGASGTRLADQPLSTRTAGEPGDRLAREPHGIEALPIVQVSEPVEAGDVLVADLDAPGVMRRGTSAADHAVIGIVAGDPGMQFANGAAESSGGARGEARGEAPVTLSGFALCKVDASYGAIRVGDLLATSPTTGRAMRADQPAAGTILGKALEPLASGTGTIRVLVTLR